MDLAVLDPEVFGQHEAKLNKKKTYLLVYSCNCLFAVTTTMNSSRTTDAQLERLAHKFHVPLNAICNKDLLRNYQPCKGGYIMNMQDSTAGSGTHWCSIYLEKPGKCAYFDSFGIIYPLAVEEFAKRFGCTKILVSHKEIQNINGGHCGQYCVSFLAFMSHHKHIPFNRRYQLFIDRFSDNCLRMQCE